MLSKLQTSISQNRVLWLGLGGLTLMFAANYSGRSKVRFQKQFAYRLEMLELAFSTSDSVDNIVSAFDLPPSSSFQAKSPSDFAEHHGDAILKCDLVRFHQTIMDLVREKDSSYCNDLVFSLSVEGVQSLAEEIIAHGNSVLDAVAAVDKDAATWDNVMQPLVDLDAKLDGVATSVRILAHVSDNAAIRAASLAAEVSLSKAEVEAGMRVDVYDAIKAYAATEHAQNLVQGTEEHRYLHRCLRDFRRNGLDLEEKQRSQIKRLQMRMSELSSEFASNLGEDDTSLWFTAEELKGLSDGVLQRLERKNDKYKLTMDYPVILPAMKEISVPRTRQLLNVAFESRCMKRNTEIMEELAKLRHEVAQMLGYPTHADYVLEVRMAKSPKTVVPFLRDLDKKLQPLFEKERERLLHFKKLEEGDAFDNKLNPWDLRYYINVVEREDFKVDHTVIQQYFPLEVVVREVLALYEKMLGLELVKVPGAHVWHEDVTFYDVRDAKTSELMGGFYLDLHPRPGKFGHAAVFPLIGRAEDGKSKTQLPIVAMIANLPKGTIPFSQVNTFFHEAGHVFHGVCTHVRLRKFSGTSVERDFVEAPSQLQESVLLEKEALQRISSHEETGEPLPDVLIKALASTKDANVGLLSKRQLVFGLLDQEIHSRADVDTAEIYRRHLKEIMGMDAAPNTNMVAGFGHLAGGYDSQYYGYMYSEVFAADMFEQFRGKILDPEPWAHYRRCVLDKGGSQDAFDMLREFLGREPNSEAFLRSKGL